MLYEALLSYIQPSLKLFKDIPDERRKILLEISEFISAKLRSGKTPEIIYVCTHNSRRSHLGQIWGKTAAVYYGIKNINTHSAGTEATAFNSHAMKAIELAGFRINKEAEIKNPKYSIAFSQEDKPLICFSKTYEDISIPKEGLCAIMTCTEADGNCPFIPGTELRISCPYLDPKIYDGTSLQDEKYNERCRQIATENLYIFSMIKG